MMLSIGLLSWRAHKTLRKTLDSYRAVNLSGCADEFKVFFNEISDADRALAAEYGVETAGSPENLGIWGGNDAMIDALAGDVVLMLQNDCPAVVSPEETAKWIRGACELVNSGAADMVRLRHRFNQGEGISFRKFFDYWPLHELDPRASRYFDPELPEDASVDTMGRKLRRLVRPGAASRRAISAIHLEARPELAFPQWISRQGDFYIVDSAIAQFTEQPFMIRKDLYRRLSAWGWKHLRRGKLNGRPILEQSLRAPYWYRGHFKVAFCDEGVFTHNRFDDSFRSDNAAYNPAVVEGATI